MPNAWESVQFIKLIPAVEEADLRDFSGASSEPKLLVLQWVVELPCGLEFFEFRP